MVCLVGPVASVGEVYGPVVGAAVVCEVTVGLGDVGYGVYVGVGGEGPPVVGVVVSPECGHCVAIAVAYYYV